MCLLPTDNEAGQALEDAHRILGVFWIDFFPAPPEVPRLCLTPSCFPNTSSHILMAEMALKLSPTESIFTLRKDALVLQQGVCFSDRFPQESGAEMCVDCCPDGIVLTWAPEVDLSWRFSDETGTAD